MSITIDSQTYRSQLFNKRPSGVTPSAIVLHTTEGKWPSDAQWLSSDHSGVSAHYVISPSGGVFHLVDDDKRAWHAGVGTFLGISDWNDISIGVECSHKAGDPWPEPQRNALKELCRLLIAKYGIDKEHIVAHRWIAPDRRSDPTDWTNVALMAWITELYVPDYATLWGDLVYYFVGSGIELAWRPLALELGKAVSTETGDAHGRVWRLFERGAISYEPKDGSTVVYQPRRR
jgi:N-acetyl-anhydromuramyl-L-alanine amidase AmpD